MVGYNSIRAEIVPGFFTSGGVVMDGFEIKVRRLRLGLRQYELAYRIGVSPSVLSAIENSRQVPPASLLRRIENVLAREEAKQTARRDSTGGLPTRPSSACDPRGRGTR